MGAKDEAKARPLAHAVFVLLTVTLDPKHPVVAWLAHSAALTINLANWGRRREMGGGEGRGGGEGGQHVGKRFGHAFKRPIAQFV